MEIKFLEWDSIFYGKKIYRCNISKELSDDDLSILKQLDGELIYIFTLEAHNNYISNILEGIGAKLYDKKVYYQKEVPYTHRIYDFDFYFEEAKNFTKAIEDLALQSGEFSRFKIDPMLNFKFEEMYSTWIEKSVNKQLADSVLVAKDDNGREVGFISLSKIGSVGKIGLIAVDKEYRGRRIGTQLLKQADNFFHASEMKTCEVVTQLDNYPACALYENNGYLKKSVEYIYHYWK